MAIPKWMKKTGCLTIGAFDSATTASQVGDCVEYVYDFGDNWRHVLELVDVVPPSAQAVYSWCVGGEFSTPPEDVGGVSGYEQFPRRFPIRPTKSTRI
jgi:pRiA4b ORF-3-like protein